MRVARLLALSLFGIMLQTGPSFARVRAPPDWRALITEGDRARIRDWRTTWMLALAAARAGGQGGQVAAQGTLLEPDAAIAPASALDGNYRCRVIKLGAQRGGGRTYVDHPAAACRIAGGVFTQIEGAQRPAGRLWPLDPTRLIFLGSMALGDEGRALDYGRDAERDMVGVLERIGPHRWRLVLPRPRWESLLDVIELTPAS